MGTKSQDTLKLDTFTSPKLKQEIGTNLWNLNACKSPKKLINFIDVKVAQIEGCPLFNKFNRFPFGCVILQYAEMIPYLFIMRLLLIQHGHGRRIFLYFRGTEIYGRDSRSLFSNGPNLTGLNRTYGLKQRQFYVVFVFIPLTQDKKLGMSCGIHRHSICLGGKHFCCFKKVSNFMAYIQNITMWKKALNIDIAVPK